VVDTRHQLLHFKATSSSQMFIFRITFATNISYFPTQHKPTAICYRKKKKTLCVDVGPGFTSFWDTSCFYDLTKYPSNKTVSGPKIVLNQFTRDCKSKSFAHKRFWDSCFTPESIYNSRYYYVTLWDSGSPFTQSSRSSTSLRFAQTPESPQSRLPPPQSKHSFTAGEVDTTRSGTEVHVVSDHATYVGQDFSVFLVKGPIFITREHSATSLHQCTSQIEILSSKIQRLSRTLGITLLLLSLLLAQFT
jgi:hypothetical protein